MSSTGEASYLVAQRYANALLELAEGTKTVDKVEKDLKDLGLMIQKSMDLEATIKSPLISQNDLMNAMNALADKAKFQAVTKNFLSVLVENNRMGAIGRILEVFNKSLAEKRGETSVNVTVAQDMTAKQKKDLEASLSKTLGKDVAVQMKVEPSILGGMIVTVGSQMIDASVARKLERLKGALGVQANENANSNLSEVV